MAISLEKVKNGGLRVESDKYTLIIEKEEPVAFLDIKDTHQRYSFFPGGACNTLEELDETIQYLADLEKLLEDPIRVPQSERFIQAFDAGSKILDFLFMAYNLLAEP